MHIRQCPNEARRDIVWRADAATDLGDSQSGRHSIERAVKHLSKFLGSTINGSTPATFTKYWNQVSPENAGKWGSVEGTQQGVFNWAPGTLGEVDAAPDTAATPTVASDMSGLHDFDFLVGKWRSHSRRLKERLAGSSEWEEFEGTIVSRRLMEGFANVDDTVFHTPEGIYLGVAPRAYD